MRHMMTTQPLTLNSARYLNLQSNVEEAVAQLRAALERDPNGFASDEQTRMILEKLNEEVNKLYDEDDDEEADEDDGEDDAFDDADGDAAGYSGSNRGGAAAASSPNGVMRRTGSSSALRPSREPVVQMPKGPTPYELWSATHEVDRQGKNVSSAGVASLWMAGDWLLMLMVWRGSEVCGVPLGESPRFGFEGCGHFRAPDVMDTVGLYLAYGYALTTQCSLIAVV